MAAKIHQLHAPLSQPAPALEQPQPTDVARPKSGGLVAQLETALAAQWDELLQRYFALMPQSLAHAAEQCQDPAEQRHCYDALRLARMEQARFIRGFVLDISRRLHADPTATPAAAPQLPDEVLQLAEIETQIASRYADLLQEWTRRAAWMREHMQLAIAADALSPAGIVAALRTTVERLEVIPEQRCLLYRAFQEICLPALESLLRECLQFLDAREVGEHAWRGAAAAPRPAASPAVSRIEPDAATLRLLHRLSGAAPRPEYDDAALTRALLQDLRRPESAVTQRLALAGRLLSQIVSDPLLPDSGKAVLEELHLPVCKVALSDLSFFRSALHPVRALINEVAAMATTARLGPRRNLQQIVGLLREVQAQFNPPAILVREALARATALAPAEVQRFLAQQDAAAVARTQDAQQQARRAAEQEIELRALGRAIPPTARPFLVLGWAPLMTRRLLRHGYGSRAWRADVARLEQVLDALDTRGAATAPLTALSAQFEPIRAELRTEGLAEAQIAQLLDGLRAAAAAPRSARSAAAAPRAQVAAQDALAVVLQPGHWFRVLDHTGSPARCFKLAAYYPRLDSLSFAGYDGTAALRMRASQFAEDLATQRSEPINPSPEAKTALELLNLSRAA